MNKSKNSKRNRASGARIKNRVLTHIPQINGLEIRHGVTLRFRNVAAATLTISFQNLLDTMLVATTAIAGFNLFQTVRIRQVRVWGLSAVGTATSASLEFSGTTTGVSGDQAIHTDTSMGVSPLYICASPSKRALASEYQLSSAAVAFTLQVPAGCVIDCDLSFRSGFATAPVAAANALVGANPGAQYVRGLDGLAVAATNFPVEYVIGAI
jgi:hypothetical protein